MKSGETKLGSEESEGVRWLKLLGREDLIGTLTQYTHPEDGHQLNAEEFPVLDREAVIPIFTVIERMDSDDPKRESLIEAARASLDYWLNKPVENN